MYKNNFESTKDSAIGKTVDIVVFQLKLFFLLFNIFIIPTGR